MNEDSSALLLWILVPLFVAVGVYLVWYSHRRKKMLEAFAKTNQLAIRPEYEKELQKTLDDSFSLPGEGLVRRFGQLSSLVDGGKVWIFRAVELLDLNPHAQSQSTHFARVAALFEVPGAHDEFFVLDRSGRATPRLPGADAPHVAIAETSRRIAESCEARHTLSVTLAHGHGLIYFEPLVTGGETLKDVQSLYCIAKRMREELTQTL